MNCLPRFLRGLSVLVFFFAATIAVSAQKKVNGTVTGVDGAPLSGVTILEKGTNNQVLSADDGKFSITLTKKTGTLVFTSVGFNSFEEAVPATGGMKIMLESTTADLDEVVVVGYTTERKRDVTGAIVSIKSSQVEQTTPIGTLDAMQGRMAGVQILSNNGPGQGADIKIRGTSTFSGGVDPLYVVDGQQLDNINNLNPNDIASIEVLKDGASAAIYGSKSANGVVIITTKKGVTAKTKVDINYVRTYSNIYNRIPVANSRQRFQSERLKSGNAAGGGSDDSLSLQSQLEVDLQDIITQTAVRDQFNIAFSGANNKNSFYSNFGYLNEEGVILNSSYRRFNNSTNLNFNVNKFFNAGIRINTSYEFAKGLNESAVLTQLVQRPAYLPVRDYNGDLFPEVFGRQNPLAEAIAYTNNDRDLRLSVFTFGEIKILPSLSFKSTLGANFSHNKINRFSPTITETIGRDPNGTEQQITQYDYQHEDYFIYKKSFGNHNVNALAGFQIQEWTREFSNINGTFSSDLIQTFNNVLLLDLGNFRTLVEEHSLLSYFGKLGYDYKGKYLISGTFRRDGSSRFGSGNRFGNFPSVSVGWRVSDEGFMDGIKSVVSDLKLRAGWAITGNERIGNYDSQPLYSPGYLYDAVNGVAPIQLANPQLSWETTESLNFGVDMTLFKGRANLTVEYYVKTTDDLLYNVPIPQETGFGSIRRNIGSVENRGLEIAIGASPIKTKNFEWYTNFNIAFNDNKVLKLADPAGFETGIFRVDEGQSIGNMFGFKNLGVFQYDESNAFTPEGTRLTPTFNNGTFSGYTLDGKPYTGTINKLKVGTNTLRGGDIIWEDLNGDFLIDATNDRQIIGNGLARIFGGFFNELKYKAFSLSALFDFNYGGDIYRNYDIARNTSTAFGATPHPDAIDGSWQNQGDVVEYPSLQTARSQNRIGVNSFYVSQGDWIKFRNIRLSYSVPRKTMSRLKWVDALGAYVSVNNALVWTNYEGYNPELGTRGNALQPGLDNLRYPNRREFVIGIKAQF